MGQSEPTKVAESDVKGIIEEEATNKKFKFMDKEASEITREAAEKMGSVSKRIREMSEEHLEAFKIHFKAICSDLKVLMSSYGRGESICNQLEKQLVEMMRKYLIDGEVPVDTTPTKEEAEASIAPLAGSISANIRKKQETQDA